MRKFSVFSFETHSRIVASHPSLNIMKKSILIAGMGFIFTCHQIANIASTVASARDSGIGSPQTTAYISINYNLSWQNAQKIVSGIYNDPQSFHELVFEAEQTCKDLRGEK